MGADEQLPHTIRTTVEIKAFRTLLLRGDLGSAMKAFGPLFAFKPDLVGRGRNRPVSIDVSESAEDPRTPKEIVEVVSDSARNPKNRGVVLSPDQAKAVKDYEVDNLTVYHARRIVELSSSAHRLAELFVNMTLLLDMGESESPRWQKAEDFRFNDLQDVLKKTNEYPVLALLGAPGSGKSTLLRRLQFDHCVERLRDNAEEISFFVQLNAYGTPLEPREWLNREWERRYPKLPQLDAYLQRGRVLLLLDALNEMPHRNSDDYHTLVGLWRTFAQDAAGLEGNRIVFSCRSLDYSASLSSPNLRVPLVDVQLMNLDQVRAFVKVYAPAHEQLIWSELDGKPQFSLFQNPFFLDLLCKQVEATRAVPKGRAALFTGFVRQALKREANKELFQPGALLAEMDHLQLSRDLWSNAFDLPERGKLVGKLSDLAFSMQQMELTTEGAQLRVSYDKACALVEENENILAAGEALNVLDRDVAEDELF